MERNRPPKLASALLLGFLFFTFVRWGWQGVNCGGHPDETPRMMAAREHFAQRNIFPESYLWPSMVYDLDWLCAAAQSARHALGDLTPTGGSYRLFVRKLFVLLGGLTILWVFFGSVLARPRTRWEPILAAALMSSSWEFQYHAHWAAPDVLMAQLSCATMLALLGYAQRKKPAFLVLAALIAGLAIGTKYTAALWMPVIFWIALFHAPAKGAGRLALLGKLTLFCVVSFLITTPGALFHLRAFVHDTAQSILIRALGAQGEYSVRPGLPHLFRALRYLACYALSFRIKLAIPLFIAALIGLIDMVRKPVDETRAIARVVLAGFPFLYLGVYVMHSLLFVRDLMVLIPFLAIWCARGLNVLAEVLFGRWATVRQWAAPVLAAPILFLNLAWQSYAAESIRSFNPSHGWQVPAELIGKRVWLSPALSRYQGPWIKTEDPSQAEIIVYWLDDIEDATKMKSNVVNEYHSFPPGPYEVNWNAYCDWDSFRRPMWVTQAFARQAHIYPVQ